MTVIGIPDGVVPGDVWHDHVAHSVPNLDAAKARLEQLGFQLTPQSNQLGGTPLAETGMANRCVMLREGYLEITGAITDEPRPAVVAFRAGLARHVGLHLMALGTLDPAREAARLEAAGLGPAVLHRTQRMIGTEDGEGLARFTVVVTPRDHFPEARMPLVLQETPPLVFQPRWLDHANGAIGVDEVVAVVPDPAESAQRFTRFTGVAAAPAGQGLALDFARGRFTLLPLAAAGVFAPLPPLPCLVAHVVKVADLDTLERLLAQNGVVTRPAGVGCVAVDGGPTLGGVIVFRGPDGVPAWR
ncbi:VOC family protein [Humitalea sp. 24SJ18S-53]|uniref:VOC family protein n=1 Tax=Humitalea sp. 24SJ18S-53 TaxID=3422307 RepID=UPI003D675224